MENTDEKNGAIQVRWTRPFNIDIQQYPPPYWYEVLRKDESDPESAFQVVTTEKIILNGIDVTWNADTPWSNYSSEYPFHLVYRANSPAGPFVPIASVNVNENDFNYVDYGADNEDLLANTLYYYKVKTSGTYGNPAWSKNQDDCPDDDAIAYEVLVRSNDNNGFTSLGIVVDDHFVNSHLSSLNNCYRVIGIDRAGNRSDSSNLECTSNCLNFELPNVITPDVHDQKNDFLTAYPDDSSSPNDCPRSVQEVDLTIYSRWGQEIYTTTVSGGESPVFWNGLTDEGKEADGGVYFYEALVIFDTNDLRLRIQTFKGWVHLIR